MIPVNLVILCALESPGCSRIHGVKKDHLGSVERLRQVYKAGWNRRLTWKDTRSLSLSLSLSPSLFSSLWSRRHYIYRVHDEALRIVRGVRVKTQRATTRIDRRDVSFIKEKYIAYRVLRCESSHE